MTLGVHDEPRLYGLASVCTYVLLCLMSPQWIVGATTHLTQERFEDLCQRTVPYIARTNDLNLHAASYCFSLCSTLLFFDPSTVT